MVNIMLQVLSYNIKITPMYISNISSTQTLALNILLYYKYISATYIINIFKQHIL